jgi:hypothetical protein
MLALQMERSIDQENLQQHGFLSRVSQLIYYQPLKEDHVPYRYVTVID